VRIRPGAGNQDTEAFAQWLTHYKKKTENDLDTPRLPDALQRFLPELERPKLVVAYAFDILPPQTKEFLDALGTEIAFCRPDPRSPPFRERLSIPRSTRSRPPRGGRGPGSKPARRGSALSFLPWGKREKRWFAFSRESCARRREDGDAFQTFRSVLRFKNFP